MEFLSQDLYNYDFFNPEVLNPSLSPYFNPMGMFGSLALANGNIPGFVTTDALDVSDPLVRNIVAGTADPSVYNSMLNAAVIRDTVEQNLTNRDIPFEVPVEEAVRPTQQLGGEDSPLDIIEQSIIGQIGDPSGLEPETIRAIDDVIDQASPEQLQAIEQQVIEEAAEENEEVVDITRDDTTAATDSELADTTTTEDAEPLPDYSELVNPDFEEGIAPGVSSAPVTPSTPTTPMTPPPGSAGVIIDIEDLMNAGDWTVFLPGVIPGLPSSPTIIGTVEEILSNPSGIFNDLLKDLEGIVTNPEQVLEDILNDAADSDGLITIGGIQSVISDIMDRIGEGPEAPPASIATEQDPTIIGGEDTDEEEEVSESISQETTIEEPAVNETVPDETPRSDSPEPEPELGSQPEPDIDKDKVFDDVTPLPELRGEMPISDSPEPQPEVGTVTDTPLPSDSPEPQPEVGGDDNVDGGLGGGLGGGFSPKQGMLGGNFPFQAPGYQPVMYQSPVSASSIIEEFILRNTGRKKGMLV